MAQSRREAMILILNSFEYWRCTFAKEVVDRDIQITRLSEVFQLHNNSNICNVKIFHL